MINESALKKLLESDKKLSGQIRTFYKAFALLLRQLMFMHCTTKKRFYPVKSDRGRVRLSEGIKSGGSKFISKYKLPYLSEIFTLKITKEVSAVKRKIKGTGYLSEIFKQNSPTLKNFH